jgi:hypothetical protein
VARVLYALTAVVLPAIVLLTLGADTSLVHEGGLVEHASATLWFIAAAGAGAGAILQKTRRVDYLIGAYVALLCGLRELDVHRWLLGWSLDMPVNYWRRPQIPLHERLGVVALLIVPLAAIVVYAYRRWWRPMRQGRFSGQPWVGDVRLWLVAFVLALSSDKFYQVAGAIGLGAFKQSTIVWEEFLELGLATLSLMLIYQSVRRGFVSARSGASP